MTNAFLSFALLVCVVSVKVAADVTPFTNSQEYMNGAYGGYPRQRYLSEPGLEGPVPNFLISPQTGVSPSRYITWAPLAPDTEPRPMLLDANTLSAVWFGPLLDRETMDLNVQSCNGSEYLTWWSGEFVDSYKQGHTYIYDSNYEMAYNLTAMGELGLADGHEMFLTPHCTAVITAYKNKEYDLAHLNITEGYLRDSYFQEIDLATGELLFHWSASEHVDVQDSLWSPDFIGQGTRPENGFDFFHINSVEKDHRGNYLISGRHTCTIYYVSGQDGSIIWRVGGNSTDFRDISNNKASDFTWQHHVRWIDADLTLLSVYDDRATEYCHDEDPKSRGIVLKLDHTAKTVELAASYPALHAIESIREGSTQVLPDSPAPGNVLNGYGQEPGFTEYAGDGTVLLDAVLGPLRLNRGSADNYRTFKTNLTAHPPWPPKIAPGPPPSYARGSLRADVFEVRLLDVDNRTLGNDTVYFSWNGATEIREWVVLGADEVSELGISAAGVIARVGKSGFEDSAHAAGRRFVQVLAVGAGDEVIGRTAVLDMAAGAVVGEASATLTTDAGEEHADAAAAAAALEELTAQWGTHVAPSAGRWVVPVVLAVESCALAAIAVWCIVSRLRRRGAAGGAWRAVDGEDEDRTYDQGREQGWLSRFRRQSLVSWAGYQDQAWLDRLHSPRLVTRAAGWFYGGRHSGEDYKDDDSAFGDMDVEMEMEAEEEKEKAKETLLATWQDRQVA